jgi:hypothetical protein
MRGAPRVLLVSPLGEIRRRDPELRSFVNINHQEDLNKLKTRPTHGTFEKNIESTLSRLLPPELKKLREASVLCRGHKLLETPEVYSLYAANLEKRRFFFWAGITREKEAESLLALSEIQKGPESGALDFRGKDAFLAAANNYRQEAEFHMKSRCRFLAERAWADKAWCESRVMGKMGHSDRYPPKY